MLNFLRRRRPAPLPAGADQLRIRNLLDDPRLRAAMADLIDDPAVAPVAPLRRVERERRAAAALFRPDRAA